MKTNELRIGNWVFNKAHGRKQIKEVYGDCSVYDPIPLTEEWLLKFGFREQPLDEITIYRFNGLTLNANAKTHYSATYKGGFIKFVLYVHQLQNLYFVLTGNELEIK
jgi:hypothetical protein